MFDFEAKVKEIQENKGRCLLLPRHYASIDAKETFNDKVIERKVHWVYDGNSFTLLDGVTGNESYYVKDLIRTLSIPTDCKFYTACQGCSDYPKLELNLSQLKRIIKELSSIDNL